MFEISSIDDVDSEKPGPGITSSQLVAGSRMNLQHVRIDPGSGSNEPHSHQHEQITYVECGPVTMIIDGEDHELETGDALVIPGGTPHTAVNRGDDPAILVDVFSPVRDCLLD